MSRDTDVARRLGAWVPRLSLQSRGEVLATLLVPSLPPRSVPHVPFLAHFGGPVPPDSPPGAPQVVAAHSAPTEIQALGPAELGFTLPHAGSLTYSGPWTFLESQEVHGPLKITFLNA